jgi:hypothetical protein
VSSLTLALADGEIPITTTWTGLITSLATVITACGGLVIAIGVLVPILRNSRRTITKIDEVHTIVNSQRTDMQRYEQLLVETLTKHAITVPPDPAGKP